MGHCLELRDLLASKYVAGRDKDHRFCRDAIAAGSMGYVSPERLAKRPADIRDDVHAFGRALEDVLDAVGGPEDPARFQPLVKLCTGDVAARPAHARDLVVRIQAQ